MIRVCDLTVSAFAPQMIDPSLAGQVELDSTARENDEETQNLSF